MIAELGPETKVIATGGFARLLTESSRTIKHVDDNLTLDGVRLIYERNQDRVRRRAQATAQHAVARVE
jgi:type III pantothenate kinase